MNTTKRNYESLYIIDSTLADEQTDAIISKFSTLITDQGGEVQAAGRWDRRRLAYEVKGRREGMYILMYFSGEPAVEKELDRVFRISDDVFRHIILRIEPERVDTSRIERPGPSSEQVAPARVEETPVQEEAVAEAPVQEEAAVEAPVEEVAAVESPAEEVQAAEEPAEEPAAEETPAKEEEAAEPAGE